MAKFSIGRHTFGREKHYTHDFVVGGVQFPVLKEDIAKFPGSFFDTATRNETWDKLTPIEVQRDDKLFRFVNSYLTTGTLPRMQGKLDLPAETIAALREEAAFYNLRALQAECSVLEHNEDPNVKLQHYKEVPRFISSMPVSEKMVCAYPTSQHSTTDLLVLLGNIGSPFCVTGMNQLRDSASGYELYKSSTSSVLNIPELLAAAHRGAEPASQPSARMSYEVPVSLLNKRSMILLPAYTAYNSLAANLELVPQVRSLVLSQPGDHMSLEDGSLEAAGNIGTLVLILNSEYTGGELEITHNGQTEVVTGGAYSWVAMYGDCLHKINPVTSGTRVSLIFDIYAHQPSLNRYEMWKGTHPNPLCNPRGITPRIRAMILDGLEKELGAFDAVVISLTHCYPLLSAGVRQLKDVDRMLYELLRDAYDVQMVTCSVYSAQASYSAERDVEAGLFTSFTTASDTTEEEQEKGDGQPAEKRARREHRKLLLPFPINADCALEYSPNTRDQVGKYLVSGLQVCKRV
jgi:hypothetical protein